jgi:hypothetical protein
MIDNSTTKSFQREIKRLNKIVKKMKRVDFKVGLKIAWVGLGVVFGVAPFLPIVLVAGRIILVIGVIAIVLDR